MALKFSVLLALVCLLCVAYAAPINYWRHTWRTAKTERGKIVIWNGKEWDARFLVGGNLATTIPSSQPGNLGLRMEDYLRWFCRIKELHGEVVRLYTLMQPYFYEALVKFNRQLEAKGERPIYLIQGVFAAEDQLAIWGIDAWNSTAETYMDYGDGFTEEETFDRAKPNPEEDFAEERQTRNVFAHEIRESVNALHGNYSRLPLRGQAWGQYRYDVSEYLLGWALGFEWSIGSVRVTNSAHPDFPPYRGTYFQAKENATAFESWLAFQCDVTATEEMKYRWQRPISFVTYASLDPLTHPYDPDGSEDDRYQIDPTNIEPTEEWWGGYYATYNVQPFYPLFMRFQFRGEREPYGAYLKRLRAYHGDVPIMIGEFGVGSSPGTGHQGLRGRHVGNHTEVEQGYFYVELMEAMVAEGITGCLFHRLVDDWFLATFNTFTLERPRVRRPFWYSSMNNECHTGLIAHDPRMSRWGHSIKIDGLSDDWDSIPHKTVQYSGFEMSMAHDAGFLYLRFDLDEGTWMTQNGTLAVGFDTVPNSGSKKPDKAPPSVEFDFGAETMLIMRFSNVTNGTWGQMYIHPAYDQHFFSYGREGSPTQMMYTTEKEQNDTRNLTSDAFREWRLIKNLNISFRADVNDPLYDPEFPSLTPLLPDFPFQDGNVGWMQRGISDPQHPSFDTRATWYANGTVLEVRVNWLLLGFMDPSQRMVWESPFQHVFWTFAYPFTHTVARPLRTEGVRTMPTWVPDKASAVNLADPCRREIFSETQGKEDTSTFRRLLNHDDPPTSSQKMCEPLMYRWRPWNKVWFHERLKGGHPIVQRYLRRSKHTYYTLPDGECMSLVDPHESLRTVVQFEGFDQRDVFGDAFGAIGGLFGAAAAAARPVACWVGIWANVAVALLLLWV